MAMVIINPRRMRLRVMVVVPCVCVCNTKLTATYFICDSKVRDYKVPYKGMICVDFSENTLFASFGVIC